MKRIEKDFSELDLSAVDLNSGNWAWGRGGHPHENHEWSISHIDSDMVETRYKAPHFINVMLTLQERHGKESAQATMREALGY